MSRRAFLVFGPESSGTRLLTSIFVAAGCDGDVSHEQRFDWNPPQENLIVWRRSFPHDHAWPDVMDMVSQLRSWQYEVKVAVITRDWHCLAASQVQNGHAANRSEATDQIQEAYLRIFTGLKEVQADFMVVSYESLVQRPNESIDALMKECGLPTPGLDIHDGNAKYFS